MTELPLIKPGEAGLTEHQASHLAAAFTEKKISRLTHQVCQILIATGIYWLELELENQTQYINISASAHNIFWIHTQKPTESKIVSLSNSSQAKE